MRIALIFISLGLYILSCALPPYKLDNGGYYGPGLMCLLLGVFSIGLNGFAFLAWLANFPYWFGAISNFFKWPVNLIITVQAVGLLLSLGAFAVTKVTLNEAGTEASASITYGAFVWMLSMFLMMVASILKKL